MTALIPGPDADQALLDHAVELLQEAGDLTLNWFDRDDLAIDQKGDGTPVTAADRAAEAGMASGVQLGERMYA